MKAIKDEALRMAIKRLEKSNFELDAQGSYTTRIYNDEAIQACKEALAETQEPVAYVCIDSDAKETSNIISVELQCHTELYTTLPSHEWVGLSDEEISELWYKSQNDVEGVNLGFTTQEHFFAGMIEAKLRERNNGA